MPPHSTLHLSGVPTAAWGYVAAQAVIAPPKGHKAPPVLLVVAPDTAALDTVAAALRALMTDKTAPHKVVVFPPWDANPYDRAPPSAETQGERLAVVEALHHGERLVIVTCASALGVRVPPAGQGGMTVEVGQTVVPQRMAQTLVEMGYTREDIVQTTGTFALRGGLVDVWPAAAPEPIRIDLFDAEVESLRTFEPHTQKSTGACPQVFIGAAGVHAGGEEAVRHFRESYRSLFPDGTQDDLYVAISEGQNPPEAALFLPLFYTEPLPTLLDLLPPEACIVRPDTLPAQAESWEELVQQAYAARKAGGGMRALPPAHMFVSAAEIMAGVGTVSQMVCSVFDDGQRGGATQHAAVRGHMLAVGNRHAAVQAATKELLIHRQEGWHIALTAPTAPALAQFLRALEGEGLPPVPLLNDLRFGKSMPLAQAAVSGLKAGWADSHAKLMVMTDSDVFGARIGGGLKRRKRSPDEIIAHFSVLHEGDYIVHEHHGIGKYAGLVTMTIEGKTQDFLKLLYAGDDRLLLPVENLDLLSRYKGAEAGVVTLDRLGTGGWEVRKAAVKADLMEMADDLLATAAARQTAERPQVTCAPGLYDEFCAGFPYPLTEDQQRVMDDVEADFAKGEPMDRLVVGDVGFGKTEVALRAAFLMAGAGRQVAVVCPTTLLARQHFEVFQERFSGFPMRVGRLSRLVGTQETKTTKEGLASGAIDIVIGTHALLSKGLAFKNLGLVVVDEEQRFGVAHKEKLKQIRAEVDVLTLTATPIPRTLQMAVGGVRQLSLITTPPVDRQAVQTHVLAWDNVTLKAAITRELVRGGQVYVVAPHVEDLPRLHESLLHLVPEARIGIAHGQMAEGTLEEVMVAFYEGTIDILLATTIIESGLDVPKANTMIIYRADRFGLAQLYQLRGRVGRSTAKAFAYLLLPEGPLSAEATKRLQILQRLEGLGAGFTLASYDMDLRGFGNLLGKQQSGNIRDIGFELYTKMLKEAVQNAAARKARKGAEPPAGTPLRAGSTVLKLGVSYLIPESYVADVATRLDLYRRLANCHDDVEGESRIAQFRDELKDRFGAPPSEVEALLDVVSLKNRAAALNVSKVDVGDKGVVVGFEGGRFTNPAGLVTLISKLAGVVTVRPAGRGQELVWHRRMGEGTARLRGVGAILAELESVAG